MAPASDHLLPSRPAGLPTWLLTRTAAIAHQHVVDALAAADAREHHYLVLAALNEVGPVSPSMLARDTGMDRGVITATAGILNRKGYVERTADRTDRRRTLLSLTRTGRHELDKLNHLVFRAQADLLADLANRDRDKLIRLLTAILTCHRHRNETDHSARDPYALRTPEITSAESSLPVPGNADRPRFADRSPTRAGVRPAES